MSQPHSQIVRHHAYLDALGIACYVSARDLPGAAPSERQQWQPGGATPAPVQPVQDTAQPAPNVAQEAGLQQPARRPLHRAEPEPAVAQSRPAPAPVARFTLCAVVSGPCMWLEELPGSVLGREQVQLMAAMAHALGMGSTPRVSQFDWPPHNNPQLDLGADAARAALHSFLERQVEQQGCQTLVALGAAAQRHLGDAPIAGARCIQVPASTAEMLADPGCKRAVWEAIRPLRSPAKDAVQGDDTP